MFYPISKHRSRSGLKTRGPDVWKSDETHDDYFIIQCVVYDFLTFKEFEHSSLRSELENCVIPAKARESM